MKMFNKVNKTLVLEGGIFTIRNKEKNNSKYIHYIYLPIEGFYFN